MLLALGRNRTTSYTLERRKKKKYARVLLSKYVIVL